MVPIEPPFKPSAAFADSRDGSVGGPLNPQRPTRSLSQSSGISTSSQVGQIFSFFVHSVLLWFVLCCQYCNIIVIMYCVCMSLSLSAALTISSSSLLSSFSFFSLLSSLFSFSLFSLSPLSLSSYLLFVSLSSLSFLSHTGFHLFFSFSSSLLTCSI